MPVDTFRSQALGRSDPTFSMPHASARRSLGGEPVNLLGAPPARDVVELTELARGLSSPDAAFVDAPFTLPLGNRIDLLA